MPASGPDARIGVTELPPTETLHESAAETLRLPELAQFYRPLGTDDTELIRELGGDFPNDPAEQTRWLHHANELIAAGGEKLTSHVDRPYAETIYEARRQFLQLLPVASEASMRSNYYFRNALGYDQTPPRPDDLLANLRILHDYLEIDVCDMLTRQPITVGTTPGATIATLDNLASQGFDPRKCLRGAEYIIYFSPENINKKITLVQCAARDWGWPDSASSARLILEQNSCLFSSSERRLRVLVCAITECYRGYPPVYESSCAGQLLTLVIKSREAVVAAHLRRRGAIRTIGGIARQASFLEGYSNEQLRGYIVRHPDAQDNPVAQTYLREYPLADGELDGLPVLDELPTLRRNETVKRTPEYTDYATHTAADSQRRVIDAIRRMRQEPSPVQAELFTAVARGLVWEETHPRPWNEPAESDQRQGREARKRLVAMYAAKALDLRPSQPSSEDMVQTRMLGLLLAVIDFSRRWIKDEAGPSPEAFWPYAKRKISVMQREELFGYSPDGTDERTLTEPAFGAV